MLGALDRGALYPPPPPLGRLYWGALGLLYCCGGALGRLYCGALGLLYCGCGALGTVLGLDTQLVADKTYFVAEAKAACARIIVGCGGWSNRKTLFGSDHAPVREPEFLDPATDAAKIRAFFIHPDWARRGLGSRILEACESAARAAGFSRFEMGATLTGVPLYLQRGYHVLERIEVPLSNGAALPIVRMAKSDSAQIS